MKGDLAIHLDLDGAWAPHRMTMPTCDLSAWGPPLRYSAPRRTVEEFYQHVAPQLRPFVLYGSGDFHYLAGLWLRQVHEPIVLISFDNHPDWDTRPPHWGCGGWLNRALELPYVQRAVVWGCGNFEFNWPWRLFANRAALRSGRLQVHPWAERQTLATQRRYPCLTRQNWQEQFAAFAGSLAGRKLYVTIDLDCLQDRQALTNWESGLFMVDDLVWALRQLHAAASMVAGDLCGAWSAPAYARAKQRLAAKFDHPQLPPRDPAPARALNHAALERIWPALIPPGA